MPTAVKFMDFCGVDNKLTCNIFRDRGRFEFAETIKHLTMSDASSCGSDVSTFVPVVWVNAITLGESVPSVVTANVKTSINKSLSDGSKVISQGGVHVDRTSVVDGVDIGVVSRVDYTLLDILSVQLIDGSRSNGRMCNSGGSQWLYHSFSYSLHSGAEISRVSNAGHENSEDHVLVSLHVTSDIYLIL